MGLINFDSSGLLGAAGRYDDAATQAAAARSALDAASPSASALGSTSALSALGAALTGFHAHIAGASAGQVSALSAFAQRLHGTAMIGDEGTAATTSAAGG